MNSPAFSSSFWRLGAARRCGLECGASGVKMVLLSGRGSSPCVETALIDELHPEERTSPASPLERATRFLVHQDMAGARTVFVPDGAAKTCFAFLPAMNKTDSEAALLLQAQRTLSWSRTNPLVAHEDSPFPRDRTGSVVALGDWAEIRAWGARIEESGGILEDATVRACAYEALARRQQWAREFPVVLLADIGVLSTCFYVLDRGRVRFIREAPAAGDAVLKALTTEISTDQGPLRLTHVEAEEFKTRGNYSRALNARHEAPPVSVPWSDRNAEYMDMMIRPVIERISSEIARSIQFFQENAGQKVEAVFLTGGSSELPNLITHIESAVRLPVRFVDPFQGLTFRTAKVRDYVEKQKSRLAVAAGLALGEPISMSLLPRPVRIAQRIASVVPAALVALFALGFLPLVVGIILRSIEIQALKPSIRACNRELRQADEQSRKIADLQAGVGRLTANSRSLQALTVREPLWAGVLNALANAVPKDVVLTRLTTSLSGTGITTISLEGLVLPSAVTFDASMASFLSELSDSVFFGQVRVANASALKADDMLGNFEIRCELVY